MSQSKESRWCNLVLKAIVWQLWRLSTPLPTASEQTSKNTPVHQVKGSTMDVHWNLCGLPLNSREINAAVQRKLHAWSCFKLYLQSAARACGPVCHWKVWAQLLRTAVHLRFCCSERKNGKNNEIQGGQHDRAHLKTCWTPCHLSSESVRSTLKNRHTINTKGFGITQRLAGISSKPSSLWASGH